MEFVILSSLAEVYAYLNEHPLMHFRAHQGVSAGHLAALESRLHQPLPSSLRIGLMSINLCGYPFIGAINLAICIEGILHLNREQELRPDNVLYFASSDGYFYGVTSNDHLVVQEFGSKTINPISGNVIEFICRVATLSQEGLLDTIEEDSADILGALLQRMGVQSDLEFWKLVARATF